ncbi:MAG: hypothetical protein K1X85_12280 [Ignavibacteria bacterium]|nr:hypothetical protein [Ignavibacteria bacterium]
MIETFVLRMIEREKEACESLMNSVTAGEKITQESIYKSSLSEFTKNYLINMLEDADNQDEILDRITKAVKLRFNYAIRPKWTLLTYMFGSYESRPPSDISKKLELFPFYNFYIDSINDVLKDNFSIFITRNEVSLIIDETNKAIYRKLTTDINNAKIKNFFLQIFLLKYDEQDFNLESTIPYSFIKIFLNDKYYFDIEKKFQFVKGINEEYEICLKDVIKVLMNKYDTSDKDEQIKEETEKPVEEAVPEIRELKTETVPAQSEASAIEEKADTKITIKQPPAKEPSVVNETKPAELENTGKPGFMRDKETVQTVQTSVIAAEKEKSEERSNVHDISEIKKLFSEKQFDKILERVYNSDFEYVTRSFSKLSNYKTWFEASNHLKEVFRANEVDIYNKDVIAFVDTLNDYYVGRG